MNAMTIEASCFTAFLYAGALQHPTLGQKGQGVDLDHWEGHTGFVWACAEYAEAIQAMLETRTYEDDSWPGVLEYELLEPLGQWLLEQPEQPSVHAVAAEFMARFLAWIK
jgi:hypothetical protein